MTFGVHQPFRRRQAAWWVFIGGMVLTAVLGWELHREAVELDRQRLARRATEIQSQLDARLEKSEMLLHNLRDYLMWSGESSEKSFQRWCYNNGHTINCRWLAGIALATNRNMARWPEGVPKTPKTWGSNEWDVLAMSARDYRIECDVALKSTLTNTMNFVADYGLRGLSREKRQFSLSIKGSRLGMSEHQIVMQDARGDGIPGTCFYVPIYHSEVTELVSEVMTTRYTNWGSRAHLYWLHLSSMIVAPVDFDFLAWAISEDAPDDVEIELFSSTNQNVGTWLNKTAPIPRAADPEFRPYLSHRQRWRMYGQKFSIFFYTTPLFEVQSPRRLARVAMAGGTILTLLATALVAVALRARNQQERLTEQIREARDALTAAQQERSKISRDLHDGTIQSLYAIQLGLAHTVDKLDAEPVRAGSELSAVRRELDAVIAEIRQFVTAEAGTDKSVDFGTVLNAIVQRARAGTSAQIALQCDSEAPGRLSGDQSVQLANITREALSNSLRHAKPQHLTVTLRSDRETVTLEISDDGIGFDPAASRRSGVGLTSITTRTQEMKGTLDIQSASGKGTRIIVHVPALPLEATGNES